MAEEEAKEAGEVAATARGEARQEATDMLVAEKSPFKVSQSAFEACVSLPSFLPDCWLYPRAL